MFKPWMKANVGSAYETLRAMSTPTSQASRTLEIKAQNGGGGGQKLSGDEINWLMRTLNVYLRPCSLWQQISVAYPYVGVCKKNFLTSSACTDMNTHTAD